MVERHRLERLLLHLLIVLLSFIVRLFIGSLRDTVELNGVWNSEVRTRIYVGLTPSQTPGAGGATPGSTPVRDKLAINTSESLDEWHAQCWQPIEGGWKF